jgi:hypothetical protein
VGLAVNLLLDEEGAERVPLIGAPKVSSGAASRMARVLLRASETMRLRAVVRDFAERTVSTKERR